jgi:HPt (histidine-containing phosphotransfer) domain-containing protein
MILIISENDQIIGADEEFLQGDSLESLKINFPSMSIFLLQSEVGEFELEYNNFTYYIYKQPIILDTQNANIYFFNTQPKQNGNINNSANQVVETTNFDTTSNELSFGGDTQPETNSNEINSNDSFELSLGGDTQPEINSNQINSNDSFELSLGGDTQPETNLNQINSNDSFELSLGGDTQPEINSNQINSNDSLEISISLEDENIDNILDVKEPEPKETKQEDTVSINLNTMQTSDDEELVLDFGLDENIAETPKHEEIQISIEDINQELDNASKELSIDNETIKEFFKDFTQQIIDEKDVFFNSINSMDYETLHKSAHKLKGVALNLRLNKFGSLFKNIDELAKAQENIANISDTLDNLYQVVEKLGSKTKQNLGLTININLSSTDKKILLNAFNSFLDTIKSKNLEEMKRELLDSYEMIPIEEIKNINNFNSQQDAIDFINNLQNAVKKELK